MDIGLPADRARLERLLSESSGSLNERARALVEFSIELAVAARSLDIGMQAASSALTLLDQETEPDLVLRSYTHMQVGGLAMQLGEYEQARFHMDRMRHFAEAAGDPQAQTRAEILLANLAKARGDLAQAQQHWGNALPLLEDVDQQSGAHWFMGTLAADRGHIAEAKEHAEQALTFAKNPVAQGAAELLLADLARRRGDLYQAQQHARRSIDRVELADNVLGQGDSYLFAAQLARDRGDPSEGQRLVSRALSLAETATEELEPEELHSFLSYAHRVAGGLARDRGDLAEGQRLADLALELAGASGSRAAQISAHDLQAQLAWHEWGDLARARHHAEQALALAEAAGDVLAQSRAHAMLGELAGRDPANLAQVREHVQLALKLAEAAEDVFEQCHDHAVLGEEARVRGDLAAAQEHAAQALQLAEAIEHRVGQGNAHHLLAELYYARDNVPEAQRHLQVALILAESAGDVPEQGKAHLMLGDLARLGNDLSGAREHAQKALDLAERARNENGAAKAHVLLSNVLVAGPREDWPAALDHILAAVRAREGVRQCVASAADRVRILAESADWDQIGLSLAADLHDGFAALELAEIGRGEALSELLHSRDTHRDLPEPVQDLLTQLEEAHASKSALLDLQPIPDQRTIGQGLQDARRRTHDELDKRIAQLHRELATLVGSAFQQVFAVEPVAVDHLRARLQGNVHALLLRLFPYDQVPGSRLLYSVWVPPDPSEVPVIEENILTTEQVGWLTDLTNANNANNAYFAGWDLLDETEHRWRRELGDQLLPTELRRRLSDPRSSREEDSPILLIIPSGELWGVPFAALDVGGSYLLDLAALTLLPALRMLPDDLPLEKQPEDRRNARALAYMAEVSVTAERAQLIHDYADRLEEESDPERLVAKLRTGDRYQLGVLSVHGDAELGLAHGLELRRDPPYKLSAARLLGLRLPPYLVLGACWSMRVSSGPGEEPIGLSTVALTRGAASLATAVYPVPDKATGIILAIYYQQLAAGLPPAHALRNAQREYIAEAWSNAQRERSDVELGWTPGYWAGLEILTTEPQRRPAG
ncbi:CHAT domain-containing protein [Kitasatospora sp. NPDC047058]|uniref:CHAT domain-containing protein n=1 Tax=Kitasatospora sp. NPDC047058 TaxID=3155620 RepID=UPI00341174F6